MRFAVYGLLFAALLFLISGGHLLFLPLFFLLPLGGTFGHHRRYGHVWHRRTTEIVMPPTHDVGLATAQTLPARRASGPLPVERATEMVPIEHESCDRVVRTVVFALPPAALAFAGWL